jgi:hypothetical protein
MESHESLKTEPELTAEEEANTIISVRRTGCTLTDLLVRRSVQKDRERTLEVKPALAISQQRKGALVLLWQGIELATILHELGSEFIPGSPERNMDLLLPYF